MESRAGFFFVAHSTCRKKVVGSRSDPFLDWGKRPFSWGFGLLVLLRVYMGVSKNSGNPQIIHFNRVFRYKPSILGYPYFWKHPCVLSKFNLMRLKALVDLFCLVYLFLGMFCVKPLPTQVFAYNLGSTHFLVRNHRRVLLLFFCHLCVSLGINRHILR